MQLLWCYALLSGWVHISNMDGYLVSTLSFSIPLIVMALVLSCSTIFLLVKCWQKSDFFNACILASLLMLAVLNFVVVNDKQQQILLSSVFSSLEYLLTY